MIITYKSTQLTLLVTNDDGVCEYFVSLRCKVKDENWFEQKKIIGMEKHLLPLLIHIPHHK
jgi:hypothetical protein